MKILFAIGAAFVLCLAILCIFGLSFAAIFYSPHPLRNAVGMFLLFTVGACFAVRYLTRDHPVSKPFANQVREEHNGTEDKFGVSK